MSEIRDKIEKQIDEALWAYTQSAKDPRETIRQILSIKSLAMVDRKAELYVKPRYLRDALLKEGWVKEI